LQNQDASHGNQRDVYHRVGPRCFVDGARVHISLRISVTVEPGTSSITLVAAMKASQGLRVMADSFDQVVTSLELLHGGQSKTSAAPRRRRISGVFSQVVILQFL
jgi:hypothetical protein